MKKVLFRFLVIFGLVSASFSNYSCNTPNLVWSTSNGIITYNRHTGQFEMLWENSAQQAVKVHDTIYICPEDTSKWIRVR